MNLSIITMIFIESCNTLYVVFFSAILAHAFGIPLGIWSTLTDRGHLTPHRYLHCLLEWIIDIGRSCPFPILMIALIPLTRLIIGTSLGTTASIIPLTIAAIPFIARIVQIARKEVDK